MTDYTFSTIHTPCKNCVLAKYEENTQIGCHLNLIEEYTHTSGIVVLEAYDEDKEFFVIENKRCAGYKENLYFENRGLGSATIEEKAEYVRINVFSINYIAVLNLNDLSGLEELDEVFMLLKNAKVKPKALSLLRRAESWATFESVMESLKKSELGCEWKMQTLSDKEENYLDTLHRTTQQNRKNNFILGIGKHFRKAPQVIEAAQKRVYEDHGSFGIISASEEPDTMIYNATVYRAAAFDGIDLFNLKEKYEII